MTYPKLSRQSRWVGISFLGVVLIIGCGDGGRHYPLSGTVTYDGRPVPAGEIMLEPDAEKGNRGPGSLARIKNGKYQTEPDWGVVGGAYRVRITPFDGVAFGDSTEGKPLLPAPYITTVELSADRKIQDFDIPKQPAK